jgi:hypothetical protein
MASVDLSSWALLARISALAPNLTLSDDPVHGRKLIASRDLPSGRAIMTEGALVFTHRATAPASGKLSAEQITLLLQRLRTGKHFPGTVVQALRALCQLYPVSAPGPMSEEPSACLPSDGFRLPCSTEELFDIFRCNAVASSMAGAEPMVAVLLAASLLNHSCNPNAFWSCSWSDEHECPQYTVYAQRAIAAGEELTINYLGQAGWGLSKEARAVRLAPYRFACTCERCSQRCDDTVALCCDAPGCGGKVYGGALRCDACDSTVAEESVLARTAPREVLLAAEPSAGAMEALRALLHPADTGYCDWLQRTSRSRAATQPVLARQAALAVLRGHDAMPWVHPRGRVEALLEAADLCVATDVSEDADRCYKHAKELVSGHAVFAGGWLPHIHRCIDSCARVEGASTGGEPASAAALQAERQALRDTEVTSIRGGFDAAKHLPVVPAGSRPSAGS